MSKLVDGGSGEWFSEPKLWLIQEATQWYLIITSSVDARIMMDTDDDGHWWYDAAKGVNR